MALPNLEVRVTADTADAEGGLDRVGNAARQSATAVNRMATVTTRAGQQMARAVNDNNRFGRSIQNASFQLGDFATQVGAGTSASIALGQQLPQLLGGFGILGAVLGAVVAVAVPLVRVMGDMADNGRDMTTIFGELAPVARGIGDAMMFIRDVGIVAIEAVINNIDQLLITAGLAAAYFAGPLVASFVAARVAAFSLAGALGFLRTALIRTGFGAVLVAAGYLIERFLALSRAAGGFGEAFSLVAKAVGLGFLRVGQEIRAFFFGMLSDINEALSVAFNAVGLRALAEAAASLAREQHAVWEAATQSAANYSEQLSGVMSRMREMLDASEGVRLRLGDLFRERGGDGETGGMTDAERQRLQSQLDAIRESQMTEQELLMTHLAEKKAILDEALAAELLARQEHAALTQGIEKDTADKINDIEKQKGRQKLNDAASIFGSLQSMAMNFGKKGAAAAKVFGVAQALISTWVGAAKALELPFPANLAAFAQVLATGMGAVSSIQSVNTSGGGNGPGAGSGTAPAPAAQAPLDVFIRGVGPSDMISGGQLSSLFDKLVEEAGDRGIRPVFAQ